MSERDIRHEDGVRRGIYAEVKAERERAHAKHGDTSMEAQAPDAPLRGFILMEEVGEVAREFNEARHRGDGLDMPALRKELVQVAAMAVAWADAIPTIGHEDTGEVTGVDFIRRLVGAWDCCGTCAGGVLAEHDHAVTAELERHLAAARSALAAVREVRAAGEVR